MNKKMPKHSMNEPTITTTKKKGNNEGKKSI